MNYVLNADPVCEPTAFVPRVKLDFLGGTEGWQALFFDTGARHNYVSYELLVERGVPVPSIYWKSFVRDVGPGVTEDVKERLRVFYRDVDLNVSIEASGDTHEGVSSFRVVQDWAMSSLASRCATGSCSGSTTEESGLYQCGTRKGVLSTRILRDLGLVLGLRGRDMALNLKADARDDD